MDQLIDRLVKDLLIICRDAKVVIIREGNEAGGAFRLFLVPGSVSNVYYWANRKRCLPCSTVGEVVERGKHVDGWLVKEAGGSGFYLRGKVENAIGASMSELSRLGSAAFSPLP